MPSDLAFHETEEAAREILDRLRRFRRRLFLLRTQTALGLSAALAGLLFSGALAIDRFFILTTTERGALTFGALGVAAAATLAAFAWALRPLGLLRLARRIESREPALEEGLLTSVEMSRLPPREKERFAPELVGGLFHTTASRLARIPVERIADPRLSRGILMAAAIVWASIGAVAFVRPGPFGLLAARFLHPALDLPRPSTVILEVLPGDAKVPAGADVEVRARLLRGGAHDAIILARAGGEDWTPIQRAFEPPAAGRERPEASHLFIAVRRPIEYRVRAGDYLSPVHRLEPRDPPRPVSFRITYHLPAYAGKRPETLERSRGDLSALQGTLADVEIEASEPLSRARWLPGGAGTGEASRNLDVAGNRASIHGIELTSPSRYGLLLEGLDGVTNGGGAVYSIRPLPDRPPSVEILEPRAAEAVVEEAGFLDVRYLAEDDVGLRAVDLILKVPAGEEIVMPLPPPSVDEPATKIHATCRIDPAAIGARPGETVAFWVLARDGGGAEARSAERALRISSIPSPPEGPGWLERLEAIEEDAALAVREWTSLLPRPGGEAPDAIVADPARADGLIRAAEDALAVLAHVRRTAERADELGRSIQVPSPNRRALEDLGRLLRRAAGEECAAFWAEAAAVAGKVRAASRLPAKDAAPAVPVASLHAIHQAAGARMEDALAEIRTIARAERLEEAIERTIALETDARALAGLPPEARGAERRAKDLARESLSIAAEVSRLGRLPARDEKLAAAEAALLEAAREVSEATGEAKSPDGLHGALERALPGIASAAAALAERYGKEERLAAAARWRLDPGPAVETALERVATALAADGSPGGSTAPSAALTVLALLSDEIAVIEAMEYADLDSSSDLHAVKDLVERLAGEIGSARAATDAADLATRARDILAALRATAPSRRIGRSIQEIDRAAAGEEEIAWHLRGATPGNHRTIRHLTRAEREVLRALEAARAPLDALKSSHPSLGEVLPLIDESAAEIEGARAALAAAAGGTDPAPIEGSAESARGAAGRLDEAVEALERFRSTSLAEARVARAWLRSEMGGLADRIARAAGMARDQSARARDASGEAGAPDSAVRVLDLLTDAEGIRGETERLQGAARREGDRLISSGASVERIRLHDTAGSKLGAVASGPLLAAVRSLRASDSADQGERAGLILEAAVREEEAAGELEALARALAAVEADEALRVSMEDLAGILASAPAANAPSPDEVARDARAFLDATLRAAENASARLRPGAVRDSVVRVLRSAAELFQKAIEEAAKPDAAAALESYRAGRARLEEAVALLEEARRASEGAVAEAEKTLEPPAPGAGEEGKDAEMTRELQAAYEELERIIALRALEKSLAARIDALSGEAEPAPKDLEAAVELARLIEEQMEGNYLSMDELVALVAKLIAIDRRTREVARDARSLAAASDPAPAAVAAGLARVVDGARTAASEFHGAGLKLSGILPHVLRAYWKASDALEPFLRAADAAAREPPTQPAPGKLLDAAGKADSFAGQVEAMRREALEALADLERGGSGQPSAHANLEGAKRSIREAAGLLREGKIEAAASALKGSARSIADAAGSIRSRLAESVLPGGEEGALISRVLDEEATRRGLAWSVTTRGEETRAEGARTKGAEEMPFPAEFRDLIRVYLEALSREGRR
jgi:hypothetical protein